MRLWRRFFSEPFLRCEQESLAYLESSASTRPDVQVMGVLIVSALSLTYLRYFGISGGYANLAQLLAAIGCEDLASRLVAAVTQSPSAELNRLAYWAVNCVLAYFVGPALVIKLAFRQPLREYGFRVHGIWKDSWAYAAMYLVMIPVVFMVSRRAGFLATYPFYKLRPGEPMWPNFYCWELLYALQFVALEFFFRGFMLHGTKRRLGYYAIFVMTVPYCMIHFHKPLLETLAAIIAGVLLGALSLKTRSIWFGAALHIGVAWLMDTLALWRQGLLTW